MVLMVANKAAVYRLLVTHYFQPYNQKSSQSYFKKQCFASCEVFYLSLTLFSSTHKYQFVNYRSLYFTIYQKMQHKTVGNQIYGGGLDIHLLKMQFTTEEMFWIAKTANFMPNIEEKSREKRISCLRLKKRLMKGKSYRENWLFKAWMAEIRATKRK